MAVIYGNPKNEKERSTPVDPRKRGDRERARILEEAGWEIVERLDDESPVTPEPYDASETSPGTLVAENMGVDLPPRVIARLEKAGLTTPEAIRATSDEGLMKIKGIGEQVVADIRAAFGPGEPGEEVEAE